MLMTDTRREPDGAAAPIDFDELLGRCVGRRDFVDKVIDNFATYLPKQLEQMEQAAAQSDVVKVRTLAHQLKGGSLTVSAHRLGKLAHRLETTAEEGSSIDVANCLNELRAEADRLVAVVRERLKKE
jgi:HPt (histidine-containing phosphotransfer) domain-containing protein